MTDDLTPKLLSQPGIILIHELELIASIVQQETDKLKISDIEEPIKSECDMNLALKNAGQRKAAFIELLKSNEGYHKLKKDIQNRDVEIRNANAQLEYQRNLLKAYIAIVGGKQ